MFEVLKSTLTLLKDRRGVTAVEYAVIAGTVVIAVAAAFTALGTSLKTFFTALVL